MEGSSSLLTPASLTSSSEVSANHQSGSINRQHNTPAKRNRAQLSCVHCRHSKLKCDRQIPCSQCLKRGREAECLFPAAKSGRKPVISMRKRLEHLEGLVKNVMTAQSPEQIDAIPMSVLETAASFNNTASQHRPREAYGDEVVESSSQDTLYQTPETENELLDSSGSVVRGLTETAYVGATHWAAILDDIEEVKSYFTAEEADDDTRDEVIKTDISLLFNFQTLTKEGIIATLPSRSVVDCLISRYFNSDSPALHLIHRPTFQKEYSKFWADPSVTPLSWIAMLFGLMSLATFASLGAGEENPDLRGTHTEVIRLYRGCCSQSLVLSDYTKPGLYTLIALLIHGEADFVMIKTGQVNIYILAGVLVRLGLRMGLHRDPSKIGGNISVFQAEMRRRLWHVIVQVDQLASFHIGLPSMVSAIESDTECPRNLRDEDFDVDSVELPPGRPDTERTPMAYTIAKSRLCNVFGMVAVQANKLSLPPYEEVMKTDTLLNEAYAMVPSFLLLVPLEFAITDSADLIMKRFSLAMMFYRSRCVLHRKYLLKEKESHTFEYSRKASLDASMKLLHIQFSVHRAIQPDGALCKAVWFMSSLSVHDFLLAATIVYLNLIQGIEARPKTPDSEQPVMLQAIEKSYDVWNCARATSEEAKKAANILGLMLDKVKLAMSKNNGNSSNVSIPMADNMIGSEDAWMLGLSLNDSYSNEQPNFDPLISTGWQTTTEIDLQPLGPNVFEAHSGSSGMLPNDPFGNMLDVPVNFDWDVFDSHMRPPVPMVDQPWPDISLEHINFDNDDMCYNL